MSVFLEAADLNGTALFVLRWVAQALLYGSVLAVLTWVILASLLRRARVAVHGLLWLIVLLKFLVPVGPGFAYSLTSGLATVAKPFVELRNAAGVAVHASGAADDPVYFLDSSATENAGGATSIGSTSGWPIAALAVGAYLIVVVGVATARIWRYRRFRRWCRGLPGVSEPTRRLVASACRQLGVRRAPDTRLSDEAPAPFILGIFSPILVLSRRQLTRPDELEAVVLHEVAHLRRGDLLVRHLQWLAGTLLFFWPVVAWVNRRIDLAREHACDEWALRHGRISAGRYARCLLNAFQPARSGSLLYRPTAMAANVSEVERRIEMILRNPPTRRHNTLLGTLGVVALTGWCAFVLTGAGASKAVAQDADQEAQPTIKHRIVVQTIGGEDGGQTGEEKIRVFVTSPDGLLQRLYSEDGSVMHVAMRLEGGRLAKHLAQFAEQHPTADADGNGEVTRAEYDAYLIALAMSAPDAVLEEFSEADRDENEKLSSPEAARLVHGSMGGLHAPQTIVSKLSPVSEGEGRPARVQVRLEADEGEESRLTIVREGTWTAREQHVLLKKMASPGQWLLKNIEYTPTTDEVGRYVSIARETPSVMFLERHPEADADGDGKLTSEERETFLNQMATRALATMLERFPEADADGNGVLTQEELSSHFLSRGGEGASWFSSETGQQRIIVTPSSDIIHVEVKTADPEEEDK